MNVNYFKAVALVFLLGFSFSSTAQENISGGLTDGECRALSDLAEAIMKNRQAGVAMTRAMEVTDGIEIEYLRKLVRGFVIEAYKEPHYQTESYKQRAITNFSDVVYLECLDFVI